jgi:hypothetical protein
MFEHSAAFIRTRAMDCAAIVSGFSLANKFRHESICILAIDRATRDALADST